jgi:hypothetical protein
MVVPVSYSTCQWGFGVFTQRSTLEPAMATLGFVDHRNPCRLRLRVLGGGLRMHSEQAFLVGDKA